MGTTVEKMDNCKARINFSVDAATFEEGVQFSYNKNKSRINIQGFRKGKAPRKLIEVQYGKEVFYDDAISHVLPKAYAAALKESGLDAVSRPDIEVENVNAEEGVTFSAVVTLRPEITVSNYKGITYKMLSTEVTEEDIDAEIKRSLEQNSREISVTDRPVQDGDTVVIDYKGSVDGEFFEGGTAQDHELVIGSKTFIDGFEDQLIGHEIASDVDVNVTFPEEYHAPDLAGKQALFQVEIKEIRVVELPELTDEFISDISEFDTVEEYKKDITDKLIKSKEAEALADREQQIMKSIIANTEFDVPEVMIESQIDSAIQSFENYIKRQGLTLDVYMQYMGQSEASLRNVYREQSEEQVRGRLCLEAVARAENIQISDEQIEEDLDRVAAEYNISKEEIRKIMQEDQIKGMVDDLKIQKAMELLIENAVSVEA